MKWVRGVTSTTWARTLPSLAGTTALRCGLGELLLEEEERGLRDIADGLELLLDFEDGLLEDEERGLRDIADDLQLLVGDPRLLGNPAIDEVLHGAVEVAGELVEGAREPASLESFHLSVRSRLEIGHGVRHEVVLEERGLVVHELHHVPQGLLVQLELLVRGDLLGVEERAAVDELLAVLPQLLLDVVELVLADAPAPLFLLERVVDGREGDGQLVGQEVVLLAHRLHGTDQRPYLAPQDIDLHPQLGLVVLLVHDRDPGKLADSRTLPCRRSVVLRRRTRARRRVGSGHARCGTSC